MSLSLKNKLFILLSLLSVGFMHCQAQSTGGMPVLGAEIFIEPGQTPERIDTWVHALKQNGMTITRIRLAESFMHRPDNSWDYTLFDAAYKAGEKYGIRIYGNLAPATGFADIGGFKFPRDSAHLRSIANYIAHVIPHFMQFKSSCGWVPINEPGGVGVPDDDFARAAFTDWKAREPAETYQSGGFVYTDFARQRFLLDYNTWYLTWLIRQIRKYDTRGEMHVNDHALFNNAGEYDFPAWRKNLTSLGGSAHASWHFGYFKRQQYALAMAANSEMVRSGAGPLPWMMTELQGGNNTYSGLQPMCPTREEVAQWFWTTIGKGSKGAMFWCMNPRASGAEAGEWGLLDFQDQPSDRLLALKVSAQTLATHSADFSDARVVESGIHVLYVRESLWTERQLQTGGVPYEGRNVGGVMKSALGYFEALTDLGLQANLKELREFDFSKADYHGQTIILAHQIAIPSSHWQALKDFVAKGGLLIADGLTGYYDEHAVCVQQTGFPLADLFGGNIREYKLIGNIFRINVNGLNLSAHLWRGSISPAADAKVISTSGPDITGITHAYGKGRVIWMPSLLGLGARVQGEYLSLCNWLSGILKDHYKKEPFSFIKPVSGMLMDVLATGDGYITVLINKTGKAQQINLNAPRNLSPEVIFADHQGRIDVPGVRIGAEETMVIKWNTSARKKL